MDHTVPTTREDDLAPALRTQVEIVDPEPHLAHLEARYGIKPEHLAPYVLFRTSGQYVTFAARDHVPTEHPAPQNIGVRLLRTHMRHPKLTTDAAMILGRHATRNVIGLDAAQAEAFMAREEQILPDEQTERCTGTGYVIVRHEGVTLGVGLYHARSGTLESHLPKVRAREVEV